MPLTHAGISDDPLIHMWSELNGSCFSSGEALVGAIAMMHAKYIGRAPLPGIAERMVRDACHYGWVDCRDAGFRVRDLIIQKTPSRRT